VANGGFLGVKGQGEGHLGGLILLEPILGITRSIIHLHEHEAPHDTGRLRGEAWKDLHDARDGVDLDVHAIRLLCNHDAVAPIVLHDRRGLGAAAG